MKLNISRCTLDSNTGLREDDMVIDMDIETEDAESNAILDFVNEVDMDIDMLGGKTIGRLDVVISKDSVKKSYQISGAEASAFNSPEANLTAVTGKAHHPSLVIKNEICEDISPPPGFGPLSKRIRSDVGLVMGVSSGQLLCSTIPPSFGVSSEQLRSNKPPGFADVPPGFPARVKTEK